LFPNTLKLLPKTSKITSIIYGQNNKKPLKLLPKIYFVFLPENIVCKNYIKIYRKKGKKLLLPLKLLPKRMSTLQYCFLVNFITTLKLLPKKKHNPLILLPFIKNQFSKITSKGKA